LRGIGIIETDVYRFDGDTAVHIRLKCDQLEDLLKRAIQSAQSDQSEPEDVSSPEGSNCADGSDQAAHSSPGNRDDPLTETTAETTSIDDSIEEKTPNPFPGKGGFSSSFNEESNAGTSETNTRVRFPDVRDPRFPKAGGVNHYDAAIREFDSELGATFEAFFPQFKWEKDQKAARKYYGMRRKGILTDNMMLLTARFKDKANAPDCAECGWWPKTMSTFLKRFFECHTQFVEAAREEINQLRQKAETRANMDHCEIMFANLQSLKLKSSEDVLAEMERRANEPYQHFIPLWVLMAAAYPQKDSLPWKQLQEKYRIRLIEEFVNNWRVSEFIESQSSDDFEDIFGISKEFYNKIRRSQEELIHNEIQDIQNLL
jgi:hypothetical protein